MGIPTKVVSDLKERLTTLLGDASVLRAKRRATLQDMRRSMQELRRLGETLTTHTARHHTQHVLGKLGVRSRSRAAALVNDFLGRPPR